MRLFDRIIHAAGGGSDVLMSDISSTDLESMLPLYVREGYDLVAAEVRDELDFRAIP